MLIAFAASEVTAQQSYLYGLPYLQAYNPKDYDGLGQNWDVLQGDDGLMYFASKTGILTFDGKHWNTTLLSNFNTVRSLAKDSNGRIYVGGIGDLGYLETDSLGAHKFTSLIDQVPEDYRNSNPDFYKTHITDEGVFFMTPYFVVRYFNDEIEVILAGNERGNINRGYMVNNRVYYLLPVSGLYTYEDGDFQLVKGGEKATMPRSTTSGLVPWEDDKLLLIEYTGDALIFSDEGAVRAEGPVFDNLKKLLRGVFVMDIVPISGYGYAMNSANDGLIITDERFNVIHHLRKRDGLSDNAVRKGFVDKSGNYWVATNKGLTYVMLNSPFTMADEKTGVDAGLLSAMLKNDTLFLGTTWGIKYSEGNSFKQIESSQQETWDLDIIDDKLYASIGNAIVKVNMNGPSEKVIPAEPWGLAPLPTRPGKYIVHGFNNHLFLLGLKNGKLVGEAQIEGFWGNVPVIGEDNAGYIWMGDGLDTLRRVKLNAALDSIVEMKTFGPEHGLPRMDANQVVVFPEAKNGILFVGDDYYFEYHAEKDTFMLFEPFEGLVGGDKYRILEQTPNGNVYTVTAGRKVRFTKDDDGYSLDTTSFAKINDFQTQKIYPLPDNTVLFVGPEGLIQYHPDWVPKEITPFKTVMSQVKTGDQVLFGGVTFAQAFLDNGSGLDYKNNSISFDFSALSFEDSEKNLFRYQLEGYEESWSDWSTSTYKEYTNLSEGRYTFKVRSKNIYGHEGEIATFEFRVYAPWYRSTLAFGGYGLLIILAIWIIVRAYTHRLLKEKERLERLVEERTQEIIMQKDEIAIQAEELKTNNQKLIELGQFKEDMTSMIAHDLKNPLSVIIRSGEKKVATLAKRMLNLVLNMLDVQKFEEANVQLSLVHGSFNEVVNQAIEDVQDGIDEKSIDFQLIAYEELKTEMDEELLERVVVNLLTNAIKYSPANSKVTVEILVNNEGQLYFSVEDEGPGIPKDKQQAIFDRYVQLEGKEVGRSRSTGLGLAFCQLAIRAHKGDIGVISEPDKGAKFWFTLPNVNAQLLTDEPTVDREEQALSTAELELIQELVPRLMELKVYQSTEIEDVLSTLNAKEGSALSKLVDRIINAAFNGDEEAYKAIIKDIQ
ncbi:hypothetical protein BFP97_03320 [Roseivirga sp. 4D4]|nr:hypothetical protein BFP97_03320 [Roseivirga sp. 4D4]